MSSESSNNNSGEVRQTARSYQPLWLARWNLRSSSIAAAAAVGERLDAHRSKELDHVPKEENLAEGWEASKSLAKPPMNDKKIQTESLQMSSKSLGNEALCGSPIKRGETPAIRSTSLDKEMGEFPSTVPARKESSFLKYFSTCEGTPKNPLDYVKTCVSAKNTSPADSSASPERFPRSIVPYQLDKGKAVMCPLDTNIEKEIRQGWFQNMQDSSGVSLHPNQNIASHGVHDIETMRICTTVDSVEAAAGGRPRFSQTTHSLLITNADANRSRNADLFRRLLANMNANSASDCQNLPPFFGQSNRGVTLQPLSSSSNSEGRGNAGDIMAGTSEAAIKNESSAETDTMDMDYIKERSNYIANTTGLTKGFNSGTKLLPGINVGSSREPGYPRTSTELPDINLEPPASQAAASPSENGDRSSSRTQSLEMDVLLGHAELPTPKSNPTLGDCSKADPTSRWVKRLKLGSSDSSGRGTRSSNLAENSSLDKKRILLKEFVKNSFPSSVPKETMSLDRGKTLSKEERNELLSSQAWIKRWMRNGSQSSSKKPETVAVSEPQSLKDELVKQQLPSLTAMAMMGNVLSGRRSCEFKKKGNSTVWNTKAF